MGDPEVVTAPVTRVDRQRGQDSVQTLIDRAKAHALECLEANVGPRPRTANLEPKGTRRGLEQLIDILKELKESL